MASPSNHKLTSFESLSSSHSPIDPLSSDSSHTQHDQTPNLQFFQASPQLRVNSEIVRIPILERADRSVYVSIIFPTTTRITSILPETNDGLSVTVQQLLATQYGGTNGSKFSPETPFYPGDYCLGIILINSEEAAKVTCIRLELIFEPVTNFMLSQMVFSLYKSFGFEPSHVMKYPVKSVNPGVPFYRKTRAEIEAVSKKIDNLSGTNTETITNIIAKLEILATQVNNMDTNQIQNKLQNIESSLSDLVECNSNTEYRQEKGSDIHTIKVEDIERLVEEKELYYNKLADAEDYIEELEANIQNPKSTRENNYRRR